MLAPGGVVPVPFNPDNTTVRALTRSEISTCPMIWTFAPGAAMTESEREEVIEAYKDLASEINSSGPLDAGPYDYLSPVRTPHGVVLVDFAASNRVPA